MAEVTPELSSRLRRPEDRKPPKKYEDYTDCSPSNSSEGSNNMSDIEENSEEETALLDRITTWERVMSKMAKEGGTPTCEWNSQKNGAIVKKYFKMRRKLMSPEELACHYFWNGEDVLYGNWIDSPDVKKLLSFLRLSTSGIDTNETDVFFPGGPAYNCANRMNISEEITEAVQDSKFQEWKTLLDSIKNPSYRAIAGKMWGGVSGWLNYLGHIMKKNPATTLECVFGELMSKFITAVGLICVNGSTEQLSLPSGGKKCHPDWMFAQYSTSPYWGVVEVKRMAKDPAFLHFFEQPKKGIMKAGAEGAGESNPDSPSVIDDECIPAKKRRVTYPERDNEVVDDESSSTKQGHVTYHEGDYEDDGTDSSVSGSTLPAYVRDTVDTFFGQLFGQIVSLDCHQPSQKSRRMGIGVVGFRIFFIAFYAKPGVRFAKIPETKGGKTEVHIAGPLCILDAKDREDVARILLQLAVRRPLHVKSSE